MKVALWTIPALLLAISSRPRAEQIIPRHVEYTNDSVTDGGKLVGCVVTLVVVSPGDPRTLNFQFLAAQNGLAWKITGGMLNSARNAIRALRASDGGFSTNTFNKPGAFLKQITPGGQLLGTLQEPQLAGALANAFFQQPYLIEITWRGQNDPLTYYIDTSPPLSVAAKFSECVSKLH